MRKKSRFAKPEISLGFEIDLDFSRPWFSWIGVQIKRPLENFYHLTETRDFLYKV